MIVAVVLSAFASFLAVGLFLAVARRTRLLDRPGHRSSHTRPTPTGAGLALILALGATALAVGFEPAIPRLGAEAFAAEFRFLLGGALALSLLGLWDDARGVPALWRLLAQLLCAMGLVLTLPVPQPGLMALFVLALTWTMNAFNFMDGSDGMAGFQTVISGVFLAFLFHLSGDSGLMLASLAVAASALGFLPWNWPPARCFMGDAGSVPLGWLIGGLCLVGLVRDSVSWPAAILVLAVFHVDAGLTLLRRVGSGERWYTAHRTHVYQKLLAQGWTHGKVLLTYAILNVVIVAPALVFSGLAPRWGWAGPAAALMALVITWCVASLKLGERP